MDSIQKYITLNSSPLIIHPPFVTLHHSTFSLATEEPLLVHCTSKILHKIKSAKLAIIQNFQQFKALIENNNLDRIPLRLSKSFF